MEWIRVKKKLGKRNGKLRLSPPILRFDRVCSITSEYDSTVRNDNERERE